ncbi:MAG: DegV family EDD domain-containing protein [Gemmatimonadetes bacterium]|nr:DegV family EDD domain-containing protein [Gemmatimonadota bacterium]MCB9505491.1 DegV family EDD domain-containing protein [Gemmatimonadales bacterium]MCB9518622.1 DegV family EDD domain-containing protein [Gemmatimonadales bacterium]HPF62110.1 DegV family protein [Gemmatimonadales bacterium]HRX18273.1 DegV family protein [Gemmatimonadales bacterium]
MAAPAVGIGYLDGPRLARGFLAASDWVAAGREELNRINVFPVPDGDTGTNFSLTLRAVADALRALGDAPLSATATTAARAAVMGARGNSGMMLAHFLIGFGEALEGLPTASATDVARAVREGARHLEQALDEPREGTILTVVRDAAIAAERAAGESADIGHFLRRLHAESERVLARTPELMAVLKEAGVVDAGGKGFVRMVEGVVRVINGDPILPADNWAADDSALAAAALADIATERDFQFCTEVLVRGEALPAANDVRTRLHDFGGSVVVAVAGDILKLHVHTDTPDAVFTLAEQWGTVTARKADDMRAQHRQLSHVDQRRVAIVVDSTSDLADPILDRHGIIQVPLQVVFGGETFRDRVDLKPAEFYRRLRAARELPTTSQPAPAEFVKAFRAARSEAEEVLGIFVSSRLSGTFASAQAAVQAAGITNVTVVDSRAASLGLGLLGLRAQELADAGWRAPAIATELRRVRAQSGFLLTVATYENLIRSGRVSKGKAWIGGLLNIRPLLEIDQEGTVQVVDRIRGDDQVVPRVLAELTRRLTPRPAQLRFGIAHAEVPEVAERVRMALTAAFKPREVLVAPATAVLGTHVGEGAWAVAYQVEDGTPEPTDD